MAEGNYLAPKNELSRAKFIGVTIERYKEIRRHIFEFKIKHPLEVIASLSIVH